MKFFHQLLICYTYKDHETKSSVSHLYIWKKTAIFHKFSYSLTDENYITTFSGAFTLLYSFFFSFFCQSCPGLPSRLFFFFLPSSAVNTFSHLQENSHFRFSSAFAHVILIFYFPLLFISLQFCRFPTIVILVHAHFSVPLFLLALHVDGARFHFSFPSSTWCNSFMSSSTPNSNPFSLLFSHPPFPVSSCRP